MTLQPLFNTAQTFWLDGAVVGNALSTEIAAIDIFFKHMPSPTNNQSGINNPGVTVYIADTIYGVPQITANTYNQFARLEYNSIRATSDASVPSRFVFQNPIKVTTGNMYAILLSYDGNETFIPWTAESGWWEIGTRVVYTETNSQVGSYFGYSSADTTNDPTKAQTQAQYLSFWNPLNGVQLTFNVYVSRYFVNGIPVIAANLDPSETIYLSSFETNWEANSGIYQYQFPNPNMEGIAFDVSTSIFNTEIGAQRVYQNTVPYPGLAAAAALSVSNTSNIMTAANTLPNGQPFNWNTVFNNYAGNKFIVCNGGSSNINIFQVLSIVSNTQIQVDSIPQWTNNASTFFISPVGWVDSTLASSPFGKRDNFLFLIGSNANSSVRFVNNSIQSVTVANGTGYNNTDVISFSGYEFIASKVVGGYVATANVVTDGSGNLELILMSNIGCGFVNTANITATFSNSTGGSSNGIGAAFTYTVGTTLQTEWTDNQFNNCIVTNIDIDDVQPYFVISNPIGTTYSLDFFSQYYIVADATTASGFATYALEQDFNVNLNSLNPLVTNNAIAFVSRSNEFALCFANGTTANFANSLSPFSNSFIVNVDTTSNNDYVAATVNSQPTIEMGKYIINNDYSFEETNTGNAYARHLSTLINYNGLAEDIRVYLTVYKPAFTDIECYARIQNNTDPQSFTTEQWTRLTLVDGSSNSQLSSTTDQDDYLQLTFGFQPYPNSAVTLAGTATTSNNSYTLTGLGSAWQTPANSALALSPGSMIKIYTPLFPSNYMVAIVNSVASNTSLTVVDNINSNTSLFGNPNLIGSGLAVDLITYTHQGFNNGLNDNVVRYYNSSLIKWDGYNNLQLKIIMLSSKLSYIPRIHTIQSIGLSA